MRYIRRVVLLWGVGLLAHGRRHYLLISLTTGGNSDTCEIDAVMGMDGRWKRYGTRWLTSAAERRALDTSGQRWTKQPAVDLTNTVREKE